MSNTIIKDKEVENWVKVARVEDVPEEGGACVKFEDTQIAIFNFTSKGEWYATQNLCPHKFEMVLSRGMIGDEKGEPKVACPFHKKTFSLNSGDCLNDPEYKIKTYDIKVENENIYIAV